MFSVCQGRRQLFLYERSNDIILQIAVSEAKETVPGSSWHTS